MIRERSAHETLGVVRQIQLTELIKEVVYPLLAGMDRIDHGRSIDAIRCPRSDKNIRAAFAAFLLIDR